MRVDGIAQVLPVQSRGTVSLNSEGIKTTGLVDQIRIFPDQSQAAEPKKMSENELITAIEKANKKLEVYDTRLEFSIHELTKQIMIKVVDTVNNEIIREIPPEKILNMVAKMMEMAGLLIDERA